MKTDRHIRLTQLLVLLCGLIAGQTAQAQTIYSDSTFDVANDWSVFGPFVVPEGAPNGAFSARQVPGANPYMEVGHTRATVSSGETATWGAVINNTLVWDPDENADGPLGKIDMTMFVTGGGAWSLTVKQGNFVWMAIGKRAVLNVVDPVTISIENLDQDDFVPLPGSEFVADNQPMHPDFSVNAALISFGVGVGFSCPNTSDCTVIRPTTIDVDDLEIAAWRYVPLNPGHNGNWWNGPSRSGEGVQAEIADGGDDSSIFIATIYSYDTLGNQIFMIAVGPVDGDTAEVDVFITAGGFWGDDFDPELVVESQWGTGVFRSCGCDFLIMDLRPNDEYKALGYTNLLNYDLVPLTTRVIPCPYENPN